MESNGAAFRLGLCFYGRVHRQQSPGPTGAVPSRADKNLGLGPPAPFFSLQ